MEILCCVFQLEHQFWKSLSSTVQQSDGNNDSEDFANDGTKQKESFSMRNVVE